MVGDGIVEFLEGVFFLGVYKYDDLGVYYNVCFKVILNI